MNGSGPSAQPDLATEITVPLGITNQPRVLVRNINENEAVFHLNGVEMAFANSVRRVIMADVPTVSKCNFTLGRCNLESERKLATNRTDDRTITGSWLAMARQGFRPAH